MNTAVAFLVFNRLEPTRRVLAAIREARPRLLLVVADGPRADRPGEAAKCAEVREVVERGVDWPCEVRKDYADTNLGCARRVSSGLDWVFKEVEEAIILEDDCLPDPTFFPFCEELLDRYRDVEKVAHISGTPNYWDTLPGDKSYLFSRYGSVWGWATWRRAWVSAYDLRIRDWPQLRADGLLRSTGMQRREIHKREKLLDRVYAGDTHSWAYSWSVAKWRHGWLSVLPTIPMVENLGTVTGGAHAPEWGWTQPKVQKMTFPLRHPPRVQADPRVDRLWANQFAPSLWARGVKRARHLLGALR